MLILRGVVLAAAVYTAQHLARLPWCRLVGHDVIWLGDRAACRHCHRTLR